MLLLINIYSFIHFIDGNQLFRFNSKDILPFIEHFGYYGL